MKLEGGFWILPQVLREKLLAHLSCRYLDEFPSLTALKIHRICIKTLAANEGVLQLVFARSCSSHADMDGLLHSSSQGCTVRVQGCTVVRGDPTHKKGSQHTPLITVVVIVTGMPVLTKHLLTGCQPNNDPYIAPFLGTIKYHPGTF